MNSGYYNSTSTTNATGYEYYSYSTTNYETIDWSEEIVIKDKVKYEMNKKIGSNSNPKMNKKQFSRLVCRRG